VLFSIFILHKCSPELKIGALLSLFLLHKCCPDLKIGVLFALFILSLKIENSWGELYRIKHVSSLLPLKGEQLHTGLKSFVVIVNVAG
jgi:hypothetical protein